MPPARQIYLLNPETLSPETIAVTFAKTSRSPKSFKEIASELTEETSADFHEKWVVGYGHASVAEHAVLHIALENISRLAVENLESNRLASYTEKSSRYQLWDASNFFIPPELTSHALNNLYIDTCQELLSAYQQTLPVLQSTAERIYPRAHGENENTWKQRIRSISLDACRYYLPASCLTNVGMTINARELEHALCKMLSHPLQEIQQIGQEMKSIAQDQIPTLVKYSNAIPYLQGACHKVQTILKQEKLQGEEKKWFEVVQYNTQDEINVLAAMLFQSNPSSMYSCREQVSNDPILQRKLVNILFDNLDEHDTPLRDLEHAWVTIDVILDQGAFGELKRHRMMTLTPQSFTPLLGFAIPNLITQAKFNEQYCQLMETAKKTYKKLHSFNKDVSPYILPNAYNRRVLITLNLRTAYHLIGLRTSTNAHFAMRRFALRLSEEITQLFPLLGPHFQPGTNETWQQIENDYFTQTR